MIREAIGKVVTGVDLDEQEQKQITDLLSTVNDPEMRQELEKFLQKQARLSKARGLE